MGESRSPIHRFRTNPVEILVFAAICFLAGIPLFEALTSPPSLSHTAFAPGNEPQKVSRQLASLREQAGAVEVPCDLTHALTVSSPSVKLFGTACEVQEGASARLLGTKVVNQTNQAVAEAKARNLSLWYESPELPLDPGTNRLTLEFQYSDGMHVARAVVINRK